MPRQVSASHILVKTEQEAQALRARIAAGEDFGEIAKKHSTCPSGRNCGDLGWFRKGQMVPEFEKAAFGAKKGEVVGPVKTQFGYHLIRVNDMKD
ncbi:MAG TPA: peptidylprolyl isomerase [Methanoregulaceae archaeon]|nr:peptidylprolyl isomerase [Methanoregulaceae archaeon]